jgi:hypothetical protein
MNREEKIQEIKEHPEKHKHTFDGLQACSMIGGSLDLLVIEAHQKYAPIGTNGGVRCDTTSGACACGAWH